MAYRNKVKILVQYLKIHTIAGVLASGALDRGFKPKSGQTKVFNIGLYCFTINLVKGITETGWLRIRIMCPNVVKCLPANCCFIALVL